jgi:diguanylate cyclase (GGDEF)-like protein
LGAVVLERARLFKHAQDLAIKDPLTSFVVKDYFFKQLQRQCHYASQTDKKLGVVMLDIDDFKQINDTYGHIVGDAVLRRISRILMTNAGGGGNIISRFGGEEFIIAIVDSSKEEIVNIAENIRSAVEKSGLQFRRRTITFRVSAGAALYPDDAKDAFELVAVVDKLLYSAKNQGKNRVCYSG